VGDADGVGVVGPNGAGKSSLFSAVSVTRLSRLRPQRLLVTMLGDYWRGRREPIASAAMVELLGEFGVSPQSARSALSRLTRAGLLRRQRSGRRTSYLLTKKAQRTFDEGAARIFGFGREEPAWDGRWSIVAFSIAERDRSLRHALRTQLRWLGYAALYDGVWVSPHHRVEDTRRVLDELGVERATVFQAGHVAGGGARDPLKAWDLTELRARYEDFARRARPVLEQAVAGALSPSRALVMRTEIMDAWRSFPREDPDLPADFLPADWPRAGARALFVEAYEALAPIAEERFREIVQGVPTGSD
jgi:phenylacetic acid degradation operon negative regulatory protein